MSEIKDDKIKNNIVALGFVSFFSGLGQDMINSVFPIFLSSLGFSKEFIGFVNGLVTSVSSLFKILAGYVSDKLRQRKWVVFAGYALSGIARPLLAFFSSGAAIIGLRFTDAVGKGVKDAPRDALVAESAQKNKSGRAFGLHRLLDTMGSVVGPLLAAFLLLTFGSSLSSYKKIFLLSAITGIVALLIIIFFVHEAAKLKVDNSLILGHGGDSAQKQFRLSPLAPCPEPCRRGDSAGAKSSIFSLNKDFYLLLLAITVFSLGNSTDAFLLLRAQNLGLSLVAIPAVYAVFYFFYAILSYPIGILSDKVGKRIMIVVGWGFYAIAYFGFAAATQAWQVWPLFILYGVFYAATEGSGRALTADVVKPEHHGLAFGLYNTAIALAALPASIFAGWLWDHYSPAAAFNFGAAMSVLAIIIFALFSLRKSKNISSSSLML
jgi:MFS family permease